MFDSKFARLRAAESAHAKLTQAGSRPGPDVNLALSQSWQRCRAAGLGRKAKPIDILGKKTEFKRVRAGMDEIRSALLETRARIEAPLADSQSVLLLSDPNGVLIDAFGDRRLLGASVAEEIQPGRVWAEGCAGTNAVGTAIEIRRPIEIVAAEHYLENAQVWSCSAAPFFDPFDSTLVGVVDITSLGEHYSVQNMALAISVAEQIQSALKINEISRRMELLEQSAYLKTRWPGEAIIVTDSKGRLVKCNAPAQQMFLKWRGSVPTNGAILAGGKPIPNALPEDAQIATIVPLSTDGQCNGTAVVLRLQKSTQVFSYPAPPGSRPVGEAFSQIISVSAGMDKLKVNAQRVAETSNPVLILGETGCGKELFAKAIHESSDRAKGPFIAVNCGAFTSDLAASELFGYDKGAFTGASSRGKEGKFEAAHGGTLFLDEIGELDLAIQVSLLRVLQDGIVTRIGSNQTKQVDVRVVAATNRDLTQEVAAGRFRSDLYFRLNTFVFEVPPLRKRTEDIEPLVNHFIASGTKPDMKVARELLDALQSLQWPGNVRELKSLVERMLVFADPDQQALTLLDLPTEYCSMDDAARPGPAEGMSPLESTERALIIAEIQREQGNLSKVASTLGIARSTLYRKIRRYQIDV